MRAHGQRGELRVGYQRAASLGEWDLEAPAGITPSTQYAVHAQLRSLDEFWTTQRPMLLELNFGKHNLQWTDVTTEFGKGAVTVTVRGRPTIVRG